MKLNKWKVDGLACRKLAITLLMCGFGCFPLSSYAVETAKAIRIVTIDHPPLMGKEDTALSQITKAAFLTQGISVYFDIYPIVRIKWALDENKSSAVIGTRSWFFEKQASDEIISVNIYETTLHMFYLKDRFPNGINFQKLEELKEYRVGYVFGGLLQPQFDKAGVETRAGAYFAFFFSNTYPR